MISNPVKTRKLSPLTRLLGAAFLCAQAVYGQSYMITDLGTPGGGGTYSESHGINQIGSVVGEWGNTFQDAFLYRDGTNGSITPSGIAYAVNDSDVVVGQAGVALTHAFLYSNGIPTDLGAYGGGTYSIAWALNNSGQI